MKHKLLILPALILLAFFFCFLSCNDDPIGPSGPPPQGHYRIYAYDCNDHFLMSVDSPVDTIVDSVRTDKYWGYDIYVTPDGTRLLVMDPLGRKMEIYDTRNLSHVGTSYQYGDYFFDVTDGYAIWVGLYEKKTYFIDPVTLLPLDSIDCPVAWGHLDTVNNMFYGTNYEIDSVGHGINENLVFKIDCDRRKLVDTIVVWPYSIGIGRIAVNWRTDDIYYLAWIGGSAFFVDYDPKLDSIVAYKNLVSPFGSIAVSPDGKTVYVTDPGDGLQWEFPSGYIYLFDALSRRFDDSIAPYLPSGDRILHPLFGQVAITPDNRRAYIGSELDAAGGVFLITVDIQSNRIINALSPYETFWATSISIGPVPDQ